MGDCKSCAGGCGGCGGCSKELVLSEGEIDLLKTLGQFSFLPVARKADDMTPVYREEDAYSQEEYSLIIQCLEKRQLIYIDYTPLAGANMDLYEGYPVHGSMGLTQRGQEILDIIELQGISQS